MGLSMKLKSALTSHFIIFGALICQIHTMMVLQPVNAKEDLWVADTFQRLETLANERKSLLVINENPLDTETSGGFVHLIMSLPVKVMGRTVIAGGSKIECQYDPVRNVRYIPTTCLRILTPEGYDYRIIGHIYDLNGTRGIPADRQKKNGALQADLAKELQLVIEQVTAVGFPSRLWPRPTPNKE